MCWAFWVQVLWAESRGPGPGSAFRADAPCLCCGWGKRRGWHIPTAWALPLCPQALMARPREGPSLAFLTNVVEPRTVGQIKTGNSLKTVSL